MKINNLTKIVIAATFLAIACSKEQPADKAAQLEALKKQQAEISDKMKAIEDQFAKEGKPVAENTKLKMVKIDTLKRKTFNHFVEIQGKVDTDNNIGVTPETPGMITKVYVKRGDRVSKGKVLAEVDATLIKKGIDEIQTNYEMAKISFEKQERLYKDNVGTEMQYLQAKSQKESIEGKIASMKEQLKKTRIVAPIDGYVDEVSKKEGEMAAPGMPVFRIVELSEFKITGDLAESYISKVNEGDDVLVSFPDLNKEINAKISVVGSSINNVSRTFSIEIRLPQGKIASIRPNMIAYLKIKDYTKTKAIVVPINTVQKSATGSYVYVVDGNKTKRKVVTVDYTYGNEALIASGLEEGDKLVTFGYSDLTDDQTIKY
jgi:membrane fusion protein (multidrug efflux system)